MSKNTLHEDQSNTQALVTEFQTDDLRIEKTKPLISPAVLSYYLPITSKAAQVVSTARQKAEQILKKQDDRLLVVVGPCSIHDTSAALEYAGRLKELSTRYEDDLHVVMRVYFEKPRTTVGWKGLINDPHLDGSFDINRGLRIARELLLEIAELELPAGTEFLDTISPQYYADLITWGAIGARTTESQIHRELASGLSMPVGFKNGTGGSIQIAVDAIQASAGKHNFLSVTKQGVSAIVSTEGNDACHIILRGSSKGPNYDTESISNVVNQLENASILTSVMVDCSHGNSLKNYKNQPQVAEALCSQIASGNDAITSVMIESNLIEGAQKLQGSLADLNYGQSVTDQCVSWQTTENMLETFAQAVRTRRS